MSKGYTGISFPFRLGNRGGIVMSTTNRIDSHHITESIIQILGTMKSERVMEPEVGTNLDIHIFEPSDTNTHSLIKYQIVEELTEQEPRILVEIEDIDLESENEKIYAHIKYTVISYQSSHQIRVELGGRLNEQ